MADEKKASSEQQPTPEATPPKKKPWTDQKLRPHASLTPEEYIEERFNPMRAWYDGKAGKMKNLYLRMRAGSVTGGAVVPVLVNLKFETDIDILINLVTTAISLLVVIFVSLESVFHYREQWKNYRSTEQLLANEYFKFTSGEGPYDELNDKDAFLAFVSRVEGAIEREGNSTLNVMTAVTQPKADGDK